MDKLDQLYARLTANFADYQKAWALKSKWNLICDAGEIAAVKDAHYYLTEVHEFGAEEIDHLLRFANPLEVVADKWMKRREDMSDFSEAIEDALHDEDAPRRYALAEKPSVLGKLQDRSLPALRPYRPHIEQEVR